MSRPYHRGEINKAFEKVKAELHAQAVLKGGGRASYLDSYTGAQLWGGDPYDYDHIYPSKMVHSLYKDQFSDLEIAEIVNVPENIAVTLRSINQSKGKKSPELWLEDPRLLTANLVDLNLLRSAIQKAKAAIDRKVIALGGQIATVIY